MNFMSNKFLLILVILVSTPLFSTSIAQDSGHELTAEEMRRLMSTDRIPILSAVETTGSPYLFDSFNDGSIEFVNGKTTNVMPLRFNAYEQRLEFREGNSAFVMDSNTIAEFEMYVDNTVYKFKKGFDSRRLSEDEFVILLIDDMVKFIEKPSVSFQQGVATYGTATQQDVYIPNVTYYIKIGDGDTNRVRSLSERRVMSHIDTYKNEVISFAKTNNIDFSDPKDVKKLLLYYNSLLKEAS